jgi:hypothetical protein
LPFAPGRNASIGDCLADYRHTRHRAVEEVLMIEGNLDAEGRSVLRARDYLAGRKHLEQWSVDGCTAC